MSLTPDGLSSPLFSAAVANTAPFGGVRARPFASVLSENNRIRIALPWITAYGLLSYLTGAFFMADTVDYADDVYGHYFGLNNTFWEFGHLLWRPLGWVLLRTLSPLLDFFAGRDPRIQVTYIFVALNWLAGLACVLLLRAFLRRLSIRPAIVNGCTLALLCSNAFLNYIHSGSSYIPGLAFLLLGFYLLAAPSQTGRSPWRPVYAAAALALAVCLWFPYIFAVPGALAMPRFLLRDPYNPVSVFELGRASLLKLCLFYGLLIAVLKQLAHSANRRILWLCLAVATPVFAFALLWYGGAMERYLPLYPVFFLALGRSLTDDGAPGHLKWLATLFLLVSAFSNFGATSRVTLRKAQQPVEARMKDVLPMLNSGSRVVLLDIHDELEDLERTFPFHPIVRGRVVDTYPVLNIGTPKDFHWHQDLARVVLKTWSSDGDIWISKRVLELRPHRNWDWVEGADPHATWPMVRSFFPALDYGRSVGGDDGFRLLLPTEKNKALVSSIQDGYARLQR